MPRRNLRPQACATCQTRVENGQGTLEGPPWRVFCASCKPFGVVVHVVKEENVVAFEPVELTPQELAIVDKTVAKGALGHEVILSRGLVTCERLTEKGLRLYATETERLDMALAHAGTSGAVLVIAVEARQAAWQARLPGLTKVDRWSWPSPSERLLLAPSRVPKALVGTIPLADGEKSKSPRLADHLERVPQGVVLFADASTPKSYWTDVRALGDAVKAANGVALWVALEDVEPQPELALAPAEPLADRRACCAQGKVKSCTCRYVVECPIHGEKHHGSHD